MDIFPRFSFRLLRHHQAIAYIASEPSRQDCRVERSHGDQGLMFEFHAPRHRRMNRP
jgi:hypothetical protein